MENQIVTLALPKPQMRSGAQASTSFGLAQKKQKPKASSTFARPLHDYKGLPAHLS
jgi:hypothetical protein